MSILSELKYLLESTNISVETGMYSGVPPDEYVVLTPLGDSFGVFGDNAPTMDVNEVRLSLFSKRNYIKSKDLLVRLLLQADFVITDRRYIGHEDDTGYHNYAIDVAKEFTISCHLASTILGRRLQVT